jgi:hypothetical protein
LSLIGGLFHQMKYFTGAKHYYIPAETFISLNRITRYNDNWHSKSMTIVCRTFCLNHLPGNRSLAVTIKKIMVYDQNYFICSSLEARWFGSWEDISQFIYSIPSSSALIPMSICTLQCIFSHSFTTYEWLNRDCDVQMCIGITSRWTGY